MKFGIQILEHFVKLCTSHAEQFYNLSNLALQVCGHTSHRTIGQIRFLYSVFVHISLHISISPIIDQTFNQEEWYYQVLAHMIVFIIVIQTAWLGHLLINNFLESQRGIVFFHCGSKHCWFQILMYL